MYNPQLDAFIKVADSGSFNKAAETMYISTPAIIQQINLLESSCGFKLFIRSNHGVKLTLAGQSLYEDAKTIIKLSQDALKKARRFAESSETTVRIGTSLLYKCRLLPDLWTQISEIYPDLNGELGMMPIEGVSKEIDAFRHRIQRQYPAIQIVDSRRYDLDNFTLCEVNGYIFITQPVYADIHSNLVSIPLDTDDTLPYGLMYANNPTAATQKFISAIKEIRL